MKNATSLDYGREYKPQGVAKAWQFLRRYVIYVILSGIVCVAVYVSLAAPWIWYGSREAYLRHRLLNLHLPAQLVVFEEDAPRAQALLSSAPLEAVGDGVDRKGSVIRDYRQDGLAAEFVPPIFQAIGLRKQHAMLFGHSRVAAGGADRLVLVMRLPVFQGSTVRLGNTLQARVYPAGTPVNVDSAMVSTLTISLAANQMMRLYAGQPDPNDDAHFTIKYEIDNIPGLIDGRLENDDTVTLKILSGPATTQPVPATAPAGR